METAIASQPALTRDEWTQIALLLKEELDGLQTEIHHTDSQAYRDDLQARRQTLAGTLQKVEAALKG